MLVYQRVIIITLLFSMSAIITPLSFYYGSEQCCSIDSGQVEMKMKTEGFHLKIEIASQLILDMLYMYYCILYYIYLYISIYHTKIVILYVNICLYNICITYYIYIYHACKYK